MDTDPRTSATIDTALLQDHVISRKRDPSGSTFRLIKSTFHPSLPIAIHNYTQESLFRNAWDPLTLAARTLVTEKTSGAVVSRSFSKFFNHHERHAYKPSGDEAAVIIEEKLDGSIISLFWYADEWQVISKAQFDGPHVRMAREILDEMYPGVNERLDKQKTYVFEIVDPRHPIGVHYDRKNMVLLSVISKDAQEPPVDFDWTTLPFPRPRILDARTVDLEELRKLNPANEEGLVVKFYLTAGDLRPQRVKVKFGSYLELIKSKHHVSPAGIVELYTKSRGGIPVVEVEIVRKRMASVWDHYIRSLQPVADDFGGDPWLRQIEDIWLRMDEICVHHEKEWRRVVTMLEEEGHTDIGSRDSDVKRAFAKRIMQADVHPALKTTLIKWHVGASLGDQIGWFVKSLPIPKDLKRTQVLGDKVRKGTEWKDQKTTDVDVA